jgi:hypothetical protein
MSRPIQTESGHLQGRIARVVISGPGGRHWRCPVGQNTSRHWTSPGSRNVTLSVLRKQMLSLDRPWSEPWKKLWRESFPRYTKRDTSVYGDRHCLPTAANDHQAALAHVTRRPPSLPAWRHCQRRCRPSCDQLWAHSAPKYAVELSARVDHRKSAVSHGDGTAAKCKVIWSIVRFSDFTHHSLQPISCSLGLDIIHALQAVGNIAREGYVSRL